MNGQFRTHLRIIVLVAVVGLIVLVVAPLATNRLVAAQQSFALAAGDKLSVSCPTRLTSRVRGNQATLICWLDAATATTEATTAPTNPPVPTVAASPTVAPMPTHDHGSDMGVCGEPTDAWHPPVVNGCNTGHEHGDPPPSWIAAAGYQVMFHGHFNTSPAENTAKHAAMKGFSATFNGVDIYFRIHAASNPLDRSARYHSYEAWARDPSGSVSHWQLWYNTGDPRPSSEGGARVLRRRVPLPEESQRPIMLVVDQQSLNEGINCEQWYAAPGEPAWGWDFGWTICGATTLYQPNENATAADTSTWIAAPDGALGLQRRLEAAWYGQRQHTTGAFVSTQFGEIVNGMSDHAARRPQPSSALHTRTSAWISTSRQRCRPSPFPTTPPKRPLTALA